jgi:hypothetical protein
LENGFSREIYQIGETKPYAEITKRSLMFKNIMRNPGRFRNTDWSIQTTFPDSLAQIPPTVVLPKT